MLSEIGFYGNKDLQVSEVLEVLLASTNDNY